MFEIPKSWARPVESHKNLIDATTNYIKAIREGRVAKRYRNDSLIPITPFYRNAVATRELGIFQAALMVARKVDEKNRDLELNGVMALKRKEEGMVAPMKGMTKFIIQNESKRMRYLKLIQQNAKELYEGQMTYEGLILAAEALLNIEDHLIHLDNTYKMFSDFMQSVVENSKRYDCIKDIVNRFKSLLGIKQKLTKKYSDYIYEMEDFRQAMFKVTVEMITKILVLINKLKSTEDELGFNLFQMAYWENRLNTIQSDSLKAYGSHLEIIFCIEALLLKLQKHGEVPPNIFELPQQKQVDAIRLNYLILQEITRNERRRREELEEYKPVFESTDEEN